jgi:hypothetical protein
LFQNSRVKISLNITHPKEPGDWPKASYLPLPMGSLSGLGHRSSSSPFPPILPMVKSLCNREFGCSYSGFTNSPVNKHSVQSDSTKGSIKTLLPEFDVSGWKKVQELAINYGKAFFCKSVYQTTKKKLTFYAYSAPDECKRRIVNTEEDHDAEMRLKDDINNQEVDENIGDGKNGSEVAVSLLLPAPVMIHHDTPLPAEQEAGVAAPLEEFDANIPDLDSSDKSCPQMDAPSPCTDDPHPTFPQPVTVASPTTTDTEITGNGISPFPGALSTTGVDLPKIPDQPGGESLSQGSSTGNLFPGDFTSNNWSGFSDHSATQSLNVSPGLWFENAELNPSGLTLPHGAQFYLFILHPLINA